MGIFSRFPYSDFHRLNADWILDKLKEMMGITQQAAETVEGYEDRLSDVETAAAGAVRFNTAQNLSQAQQGQARSNIDAASQTDLTDYVEALQDLIDMLTSQVRNCVRFDLAQTLTGTQKAQARSNIGAADVLDVEQVIRDLQTLATYAVMVNAAQTFTDAQKAQARANIGAAAEGEAPVPAGAVLYDQSQSLTSAQKRLARANIGALGDDPTVENLYISTNDQDIQIYSDDPATGPVLALDGMNQSSSGLDVRISGVADPISGNDAANKAYADSIRGPYLSTIAGNDVILQVDAANAKQSSLYVCTAAELNSLEIQAATSPAANREFTVRFTSGATPTELDTPITILGLDDLVPEANTIYEINVLGNLAVWHSWEEPTP